MVLAVLVKFMLSTVSVVKEAPAEGAVAVMLLTTKLPVRLGELVLKVSIEFVLEKFTVTPLEGSRWKVEEKIVLVFVGVSTLGYTAMFMFAVVALTGGSALSVATAE